MLRELRAEIIAYILVIATVGAAAWYLYHKIKSELPTPSNLIDSTKQILSSPVDAIHAITGTGPNDSTYITRDQQMALAQQNLLKAKLRSAGLGG